MIGRENKENNDMFFVCSLIEHIARRTKNHRSVVVNALGKSKLEHIYNLADVYHSENIDKISDDFIQKAQLTNGNFDNQALTQYAVPTHWDIGKVFARLICSMYEINQTQEPIEILIEVYNSWICSKLEDYNSSFFYENPDYILQCYLAGEVLP